MARRLVRHDGAFIQDWLDRLEALACGPHHSTRARFNLLRTSATAELTFSSGILPSSTLQMTPNDVDSERLAVRLHNRWIPMTEKALEAIDRWRVVSSNRWGRAETFLFSSINGNDLPMPATQHTHSFRVVGDAIGYRLTALEIRAAFIVEMKSRGMPIEQLAYITGMTAANLLLWQWE